MIWRCIWNLWNLREWTENADCEFGYIKTSHWGHAARRQFGWRRISVKCDTIIGSLPISGICIANHSLMLTHTRSSTESTQYEPIEGDWNCITGMLIEEAEISSEERTPFPWLRVKTDRWSSWSSRNVSPAGTPWVLVATLKWSLWKQIVIRLFPYEADVVKRFHNVHLNIVCRCSCSSVVKWGRKWYKCGT